MPASPTWPAVTVAPLPYVDRLETRPLSRIDLAVIHCTELPDLAMAREYGEQVRYGSGTGNSGHYYLDRNGDAYQYVPPDRIAHHVRGLNERAIGIELVNGGRYPDWLASGSQSMTEPYPDAQIAALIGLLQNLKSRIPTLRLIAGHEDLDRDEVPASDDPAVRVRRKLDPGPLFPWQAVLREAGLERLASHSTGP